MAWSDDIDKPKPGNPDNCTPKKLCCPGTEYEGRFYDPADPCANEFLIFDTASCKCLGADPPGMYVVHYRQTGYLGDTGETYVGHMRQSAPLAVGLGQALFLVLSSEKDARCRDFENAYKAEPFNGCFVYNGTPEEKQANRNRTLAFAGVTGGSVTRESDVGSGTAPGWSLASVAIMEIPVGLTKYPGDTVRAVNFGGFSWQDDELPDPYMWDTLNPMYDYYYRNRFPGVRRSTPIGTKITTETFGFERVGDYDGVI